VKKSRFTEVKIVSILKELEAGTSATDSAGGMACIRIGAEQSNGTEIEHGSAG
jgi:hypothetical protein